MFGLFSKKADPVRVMAPEKVEPANAYLGRQPILNGDLALVGFELFFRPGTEEEAERASLPPRPEGAVVIEPDVSEEDLGPVKFSEISRALREKGVANSLGQHLGFLTIDKEIFLDKKLRTVPAPRFPLQMSVELVQELMQDPEMLKELEGLSRSKYQLCLNNVTEVFEGMNDVMEYFKFIKIDPSEVGPEKLPWILNLCGNFEIRKIAINIDTLEQFFAARDLGFDCFEGFFFTHPNNETAIAREETYLRLLKLLALLLANPELHQLNDALDENPIVGRHLMKIAQVDARRKRRTIETVSEAVIISGIKRITRWTQLLLYADTSSKVALESSPLLQLVCVRAFFMESAAARLGAGGGLGSTDLAFLTGGLSLVEVIFHKPPEEVLKSFTLPGVVVDAIALREGVLGKLLGVAEASERGDLRKVQSLLVDELAVLTLEDIAIDSLAAIKLFVTQTQGDAPKDDDWIEPEVSTEDV